MDVAREAETREIVNERRAEAAGRTQPVEVCAREPQVLEEIKRLREARIDA